MRIGKQTCFKWGDYGVLIDRGIVKNAIFLEQMVCVSSGKQTHLGSRGHLMDQRSCLIAQHICSRGNSGCSSVSNIANRCCLSSACSDGSL